MPGDIKAQRVPLFRVEQRQVEWGVLGEAASRIHAKRSGRIFRGGGQANAVGAGAVPVIDHAQVSFGIEARPKNGTPKAKRPLENNLVVALPCAEVELVAGQGLRFREEVVRADEGQVDPELPEHPVAMIREVVGAAGEDEGNCR